MKLQLLSSKTAVSTVKFSSQCASEIKLSFNELISRATKRKWMLPVPDTKIHQVTLSPIQGQDIEVPFGKISFRMNPNPELGNKLTEKDNRKASSFYVLRDDLLHPLVNGNKARKLDALLPLIVDHSVTDVVTCGGCQSAHAAAVAVSCAEAGIRSHLLLRGEQPEVLTGYNLISTLYGNVTYVRRHLYADRETMLKSHASTVAGSTGHIVWCDDIIDTMNACTSVENYQKKVLIVNEGAGDTVALLGVIRLMEYLCQYHLLGKERGVKLVVDSGTGTTAIGLGLGALCLGLPWEVTAITLADPIGLCIEREKHLISTFKKQFGYLCTDNRLNDLDCGVVDWVERNPKRKFGKVLEGEIETCQKISRETGILVDPVYTLAAWELATRLSQEKPKGGAEVVMLHTGGTLGMFGLAQRYKNYFNRLKDT